MYWLIRRTMRGLSLLFKQQCSGKLAVGQGINYCQQRAFHDGICTDFRGNQFRNDQQP